MTDRDTDRPWRADHSIEERLAPLRALLEETGLADTERPEPAGDITPHQFEERLTGRRQGGAPSATPWREDTPENLREMFADAEEELAELWSSRRGNSIEFAREAVGRLLRDAWMTGGLTAESRHRAVADVLADQSKSLAALDPIVGS